MQATVQDVYPLFASTPTVAPGILPSRDTRTSMYVVLRGCAVAAKHPEQWPDRNTLF